MVMGGMGFFAYMVKLAYTILRNVLSDEHRTMYDFFLEGRGFTFNIGSSLEGDTK